MLTFSLCVQMHAGMPDMPRNDNDRLADIVADARVTAAVQAERHRGSTMLQALAQRVRYKWRGAQQVIVRLCCQWHLLSAQMLVKRMLIRHASRLT